MDTPRNPFTLADWRRRVAEMYARVRMTADDDPRATWNAYRISRNDLLRTHPQSPIESERRDTFQSLNYFPYDSAYRIIGVIRVDIDRVHDNMDLKRDGLLQYTRVGEVAFELAEQAQVLTLYWIDGYGGGVFLPFQDTTNGSETYNGGRYLYDTIKGVDLGVEADTLMLDFNYAYNPSCAYDEKWVCPLSPKENKLQMAIEAGEKDITL